MVVANTSESQKVRSRLDHPVIDSDGHVLEIGPVLMDYVRDVGGGGMVERLRSNAPYGAASGPPKSGGWTAPWWVPTGQTLDHATGMLPKLLHERMDELGMDFSVLYPTTGLPWVKFPGDTELRQALCRALNTYYADMYREYSDRMTPAASIPMDTPQEAIAELEHAVGVLGLKAIVIAGYAHRTLPWVDPALAPADGYAGRLDVFGIDSDYDYDPFWAKCIELGVSPTTHTSSQGWGFRRSSIYMYNHIGHFAATGEALCKALFFGGVTRRLPKLRVGFLECGVGWACNLYADLVARWQKRGGTAVQRLDPVGMDRAELEKLMVQYGGEKVLSRLDRIRESLGAPTRAAEELDDFAAVGITRAEDIYDLFVPNFFFGCEADDAMNAWAFNEKVNPFKARLGAIFSSDISHWDVPDMRETVSEAYELVDKEIITESDFRDFVFTNPVKLYAGNNADFFKGTAVEAQAAKILGTA